MESEGMNIKRTIILLAFLLSTGVLLNILACVIYGQWLAFLTVIAYFFAPLPNLFFQRCGSDPLDVSGRNFKDLGYFLTGIFVVSGFALPAVLAHVEVIRWEAMALALAGGIIVYATILGYLHKFYIKDDAF